MIRNVIALYLEKVSWITCFNSRFDFSDIQLDMRSEEYRLRATELQTTLENVVVSLLAFK